MRWLHLVRRFLGSVTARSLTRAEQETIRQTLLPGEQQLFARLSRADQRHALQVLQRFNLRMPTATVEARRAALLHDIGKVGLQLGVLARVLATIVGPRTRRFADYHAHESRGAAMLERAGSSQATVNLVRGVGDAGVLAALRSADDI